MRTAILFLTLLFASTAPADVISQAPSRFATGASGKIHYKSWGKGSDALVLVHGWTCDMTYFAEQVAYFAKRGRVIAIDLPGHGKSDAPQIDYTQPLFAESIARVMDDARVKRAVLVGHSMGTPVARQFYRMYPKRTLGIVALDGSVKAMITEQSRIDSILGNLRSPNYLAMATMMVDGMLAAAPDTPYKKAIRNTMLSAPQHVVAGAATGMFDLQYWNDDPIDVPMLMLLAKSPMWNDEYEAYARKLAPKSDYVVMEGVSHFLHTEKPGEVNAAIEAFLRKYKLLR